jgi:polygalacturonase
MNNPSAKRLSTRVCFVAFIICLLVGADYALAMAARQSTLTTSDLPFVVPDVKEPKFPDNTFRITDFGAVGDGHTKNTDAFAKAIKACVDAGGGRVLVPAGIWLTGPIQLKSNLNLHLEEGAVVLFSGDFEDYPLLRRTWEGLAAVRCMPPLFGENLENIALTGQGIFDGSGQAWRPVKKFKMTERQWKALLNSGGAVDDEGKIWWPSAEALKGAETVKQLDARGAETHEYAAARQYLRPVLVGITKCKGVLLDGPTFQNSPAWNVHPVMCEDMIIRNVTVRNPWWSQNGDGLDLESCRNVIVTNCNFDVGDDAICMKSGKNEYGRRRGKPTENVAIWDCTVYHGHGGFVVGSETSGSIRNIYVKNCSFLGTDVGLRFKSTRGRGGVVENIYVQDIRMKDIPTDAVRFNMFYEKTPPSPEQSLEYAAEPVSEQTPRFQNIHFRNIICSGADNAIYMQGLPEMPVQKVYFENVVISARAGVTCIEADDIKFKNVRIMPRKGPAFGLYNSRNFVMEDMTFPKSDEAFIKLAGEKTRSINLRGVDPSVIADEVEYGKDARPDALIVAVD